MLMLSLPFITTKGVCICARIHTHRHSSLFFFISIKISEMFRGFKIVCLSFQSENGFRITQLLHFPINSKTIVLSVFIIYLMKELCIWDWFHHMWLDHWMSLAKIWCLRKFAMIFLITLWRTRLKRHQCWMDLLIEKWILLLASHH